MTYKLLVFADSHTHEKIWPGRSITGDAQFALQQVFDLATNGDYAAMVGLGDLIEGTQPRSEALVMWAPQMQRLTGDMELYYLMGQHDWAIPRWLSVFPNASSMDRDTVNFHGVYFYGLDYRPAGVLQEELKLIPGEATVLLAHQTWRELMGIGDVQGSLAEVPLHVGTVLTGDYHVHEQIRVKRQPVGGAARYDLQVWSPGATHLRKIDEPEEHSVLSLEIGKSGKLTFKSIPLKSRKRFGKYSITGGLELDQLVVFLTEALETYKPDPALPESLHKPLVWVECMHDVLEAYSRIQRVVKDAAHLFWKIIPAPLTPERKAARAQRKELALGGLQGCLELVVPDKTSLLYKDLTRLLSAGDAEAEIKAICQEQLSDAGS